MRWKYVSEETEAESAERIVVRQRIAEWWQAFVARVPDLNALFANKKKWDLPEWMHDHLNAISPDLMWEFGPGILGGHRLVITPESSGHLRPLTQEILASAPKIPGWEFYAYRLPETVELAALTVDGRGGGRLSEMLFQLQPGKFNRVDIRCLVKPDYPEELLEATAFVALETLLGQEMLDRWIGFIDREVIAEFPGNAVRAENLLAHVRKVISQIIATLPAEPWIGHGENIQWSLLTLKPESADDYTGRRDQLTQVTAYPDLHQCLFNEVSFDSARFSKFGETFAFVKIDGSEALPDWGFKDREDIENALRTGLEGVSAGSVFGGGNGLRYCYVDLALLDVNQAIPIVREVLVRGGVSIRSWLLFADRDYAHEWVGIASNSPAPPLEG